MQHAGPHSRKRDVYGVAVRLDPWFVTGLAEGEGCFCVSIAIRPKMKVGLEARPSFSLSLNERDRELLGELQAFFECGWIRESRSDRTFKYEVRSAPELADRIVPHLRGVSASWRKASQLSRVRRGLPDDRTRRSSATGGDGRHRSDSYRDEPRQAPALCRHTPKDAQ
jgi:LAGLIDADG endonuclease